MGWRKKWLAVGFAAVGVLTIIVFLKERWEGADPVRVLERNPPGMGEAQISLEARTENGNFSVDFELAERRYSDEELETVFLQGKAWLDQVWLGKNESSENVTSDLYFPMKIPNLGITVRWETESYQWIQTDGKITEAAYEEAPLETGVRAILCYGKAERQYDYAVTIKRDVLSGTDALKQNIMDVIRTKDLQENTLTEFVLPETVNGINVAWYDQKTSVWPDIFVFGNLIVVLIYFSQEEKKMQQLKNREAELRRDYPEIVYRLVLLIGSGMTVKGAWEKMTMDYQNEKHVTGRCRWGYEEMQMTLREIKYGIAELKAYENFGKRCGSQSYIRLSSLLIQQVKRGARGMNHLLMQEVTESEIMRRENVRKNAEEAGTKLLLPMVLMMTVVFAILMVPAFLSISI